MLYKKIREDQLTAQKAQDAKRLGVLRLLTSELSYKVMDNKGEELSDEQVVDVLRHEAKKREEAITIYEKAGDAGRASAEKYELDLIGEYLPKLMAEEEVVKAVDEVAAESGKTGGQLIGLAMSKLRGKADGGLVARIVNEKYKG